MVERLFCNQKARVRFSHSAPIFSNRGWWSGQTHRLWKSEQRRFESDLPDQFGISIINSSKSSLTDINNCNELQSSL